MTKNHSWFVKFIILILCFFLLTTTGYSASKKKKSSKQEKTAIEKKTKKNKQYTYFSYIAPETLADVENGSPATLRKAVSALRKSDVEYKESEKVLLSVASNIMQMVYPTERIGWETPSISEPTPYMGAIQSAQAGIYDTSTGDVDFLTLVLPSLVITKVDDVSDFFELSKNALEKALGMNANSVLANYLLGLLYKKSGQNDIATNYLLIAKNESPNCFQTIYAYTENLFLTDKTTEADETVKSIIDKYPNNIELLKIATQISYKLKKLNEAEEYILKILQQQPNDLDSLMFRTRILMDKKDYIRAASLLDVYSRQDSTSKEYLLLRAELQYDWSKNLTATVGTIENALKLYPADKEVQLFAARICSTTGTKIAGKSTEEYADAVLKFDSENQTALKYAVEGLVKKKDFPKAYSLSSKLIKISDAAENVFLHVKICLAIGKKDEAWNLISPIYRAKSSDENVIQTYIIALDETDRDKEAITLINQLLPEASARLKSFLYYRRSLMQKTENDSLSDLRSSLIANPRNSDSLFRLYQIYFSKHDYRKAQYYLKQVVALSPNDEEIRKLNDELILLLK